MRIRVLTNADRAFYPLLGPYLSQRAIVAELGGPVWDDAGKTWVVAVERGAVLGFCAFAVKGGVAHLASDYVCPGRRRAGVYAALFRRRLELIGDAPARATATAASAPAYRRAGFVARGRRGRYLAMERRP